jgi:hypothetical protein
MKEEPKGSRCPICFWGLYDGTFCQGPAWCENKGRTVKNPVYLTSRDAGRAAADAVMRRTRITPTKKMMEWLKGKSERA